MPQTRNYDLTIFLYYDILLILVSYMLSLVSYHARNRVSQTQFVKTSGDR